MIKYSTEIIEKVSQINIVEYVQKHCDLEYKSGLYYIHCPFGHIDNTPSLCIYPDTNTWKCYSCDKYGGIISFVMYEQRIVFPKAIEYLINYGNFDISSIKPDIEIKNIVKKFSQHKKQQEVEYYDIPDKTQLLYPTELFEYYKQINLFLKNLPDKSHVIFPNDIMNNYKQTQIKEWIEEGITQTIIDKFQVRYDTKSNKIVFPVFNNDGDIISIKGRTLYPNYKDLGIPKYQYYIKIGTTDFLFGYHFNKEYIKHKNEVIVVESEKSVMKLASYGIYNTVAICTHSFSDYQIRQLLALHTNVVIAFDKDVTLIDIKNQCKMLKQFTNCYIVYDKKNVLKDKESPVDVGVEKWNQLYSERFKI